MVNFSRSSKRVKCALLTKFVTPKAKEVSRPIIPLGAFVNSLSFSSLLCGAWSVAIISIVLSFKPSIIFSLSFLVLTGANFFMIYEIVRIAQLIKI